MEVEDEDGRNGDDPLEKGFTIVPEKRKLRSNNLNKYDIENGGDSKRNKTMQGRNTNTLTAQNQNGDSQNENRTDKSIHTNTLHQTTSTLTNINTQQRTAGTSGTNNGKLTLRQNKDRTDEEYKDGWVKNTVFTTFFIERETDEQTPTRKYQNSKDQYPHPMEVAKMLMNIKVDNYKEMKAVGRGRFQLTFHKPRDAEQLINSKLLTEEFKFKVYVPARFKQTIGVVRDVAKSLTEDDILKNMYSGNIKIEKVERIMKKTSEMNLVPTYSIKIYAKGQHLPKSVEIYGVNAHCEAYVFPLRICYKCWRYGHSKKFCKANSVKCCKCGLEHDEEECETEVLKCINCGGAHKASDKNCPERDRQDKIRIEMAENKTSFFEAEQKYPRKKKSVQSRLNSNKDYPSLSNRNTENDNTDWNYKNKDATSEGGSSSNVRTGTLSNNLTKGSEGNWKWSRGGFLRDKSNRNIQQNKFPQPEKIEEIPHIFNPNPYATTEIERLAHQIKQELIAQFNLTGIVEKIQAIQSTILKNTDKTETIEQDLLLINISNQLDSIINPEILDKAQQETMSNSNSNNGSEEL